MVAGGIRVRILISQRVDILSDRGERRDALDQAWSDTLARMLAQPILLLPMPNRPQDVEGTLAKWVPSLIVLSGGNDIGAAPERDSTERALLEHAAAEEIPVLAVCRGMQMVQHFLGGSLVPLSDHVAREHSIKAASTHVGPAELVVNSFHAWGIPADKLHQGLEALYFHADGTVEAACHVRWPWLCLMWHPERSSCEGMAMANEWAAHWLQKIL